MRKAVPTLIILAAAIVLSGCVTANPVPGGASVSRHAQSTATAHLAKGSHSLGHKRWLRRKTGRFIP